MNTVRLFTKSIPPRIQDVKIYFNQKGMPDQEAEDFFLFYEKKQWTSRNGNFYKSWKNIAFYWIASIVGNQPQLFNRRVH